MAGRPKTRAKKIARGECVCPAKGCPQHPKTGTTELVPAADALPEPGSAEWMRHITAQRMEMAKTDPSKKGGRARTRLTKAEAEEMALQRMLPKALKVLEAQLDDEDQRVRQKAAIEVIDRVKGKAAQTIKSEGSQVHTLRYESAAWTFRPREDEENVIQLPLPPP
jgi:hypothetical protein